jgi:hypothetical protein
METEPLTETLCSKENKVMDKGQESITNCPLRDVFIQDGPFKADL